MDARHDDDSSALLGLAAEPNDLDGHTLAGLADYLDAGRNPFNASIESSAACRHALAALTRLREIARQVQDQRDHDQDEGDGEHANWVASLMARIAIDAHAGRDIELPSREPRSRVLITEGAVKGLIRAAGDDLSGVLVGRIDLEGVFSPVGSQVTISVAVTILYGAVVATTAAALRKKIADVLQMHTGFTNLIVNITVQDVFVRDRPELR